MVPSRHMSSYVSPLGFKPSADRENVFSNGGWVM